MADACLVVFAGRQIQIQAAEPHLRELLQRQFAHLRSPEAGQLVATISIRWQFDHYQLCFPDREVAASTLDEAFRYIVHEVKIIWIRLCPEFLWLHAAAVSYKRHTWLLVGRSGQGKSALATALCNRGGKLMGDDLVPWHLESGQLVPLPFQPRPRQPSGQRLSASQLSTWPRQSVQLAASQIENEPQRPTAVVIVQYAEETEVTLQPLAPAVAVVHLLANCLNRQTHAEQAVAWLGQRIHYLPAYDLMFNDRELAADYLQTVLFNKKDDRS